MSAASCPLGRAAPPTNLPRRRAGSLAEGLRTAARLFDEIRYGDKDGSLAAYQLVSRVAEDVRKARPTAAAPEPALAGFGVPR